MANLTEVQEGALESFANGMNGPLQTLESNLRTLGQSQNALMTAFVGQAGTAVENAFGNVLDTGKQVAVKIEEIMGMINKSAAEFNHRDGEALQAVLSGMGEAYQDQQVTGGTGTWNDGQVEQNSKIKDDWM